MQGLYLPTLRNLAGRRSCIRPWWALLLVGAWNVLGPGAGAWAAQAVAIRHYNPWPFEPKRGIQFVSPAEGWVGVLGVTSSRGKSHQAYLLYTSTGPDDLQPVSGLQLPPEHGLIGFQFLDRSVGWVAIYEMKVRGATRLLRTEDGGRTWREVEQKEPSERLWRRQFITKMTGWAFGTRAVWRTDDGGVSWRALPLPAPIAGEDSRQVLFLTEKEGWAGGKGMLYHTSDGGETWTPRYDGSPKVTSGPWAVQFLSTAEGWVAVESHDFLHTTDGGRTWRRVRVKHPRQGPYDRWTAMHFLSPQVGVLAGQHNERERVSKEAQRGASPIAFNYYRPYILVTRDGGRTWSYHDLPIPVGEWSQADSVLFGINTVNGRPEATGIVEVRVNASNVKPSRP